MHDIADVLEVQYCAQYSMNTCLPQRHLSEPNKPRSVSRRRRVSQYCILAWHSGMRQNAAGYLVASSTEMQAPAWQSAATRGFSTSNIHRASLACLAVEAPTAEMQYA
jgi:hypothetical protein